MRGSYYLKNLKKLNHTIITDKTFVFTGTLNTMNRNDAKKIIESYGAKSSALVSKNTDYVIIGRGRRGTTNKSKKAKNNFRNCINIK